MVARESYQNDQIFFIQQIHEKKTKIYEFFFIFGFRFC